MPKSLYTCKTLARLVLSGKIIVDVISPVSLPSLIRLDLKRVVYKDEDSHVRLLSGCPVLTHLTVVRFDDVGRVDDNVRKFSVKVPSLLKLTYFFWQENEDDTDSSLVIDTPALKFLRIFNVRGGSCSMEYMPHLVHASICVKFYTDDNFLRSLASVKYLQLDLPDTMVPWCNAVNYSRLIECRIRYFNPAAECESLVVLLSNCPQLKAFVVESISEIDRSENHVPVMWNQPSSVPRCLPSRLELFRWTGYRGREDERELIRYVVENSKSLQKAEIYLNLSCNFEEKQKMAEELKSMPKVLTSVLEPDRPAQWDW